MDVYDCPDSAEIGEWKYESKVNHILNSKCGTPFVCRKTRLRLGWVESPFKSHDTPMKTEEELAYLKNDLWPSNELCNFCKFDLILEMSHLPDMTYPENGLTLTHKSGFSIDFNALDALSPVIIKGIGLPSGMKVAPSEAWLKARMNCEYAQQVHNATFDWTFTTDYPGTIDNQYKQMIEPTKERINFEKLMLREKILWFKEIDLFEDELADHGTSQCNVKIRVMTDCFFILLRYFLRIDNVFIRFYDTRYYHEFTKQYIIREKTIRESTISDLKLKGDQLFLLVTPNELYLRVPEKSLVIEKISLPCANIIQTEEQK